jgi:hypothetical protein
MQPNVIVNLAYQSSAISTISTHYYFASVNAILCMLSLLLLLLFVQFFSQTKFTADESLCLVWMLSKYQKMKMRVVFRVCQAS